MEPEFSEQVEQRGAIAVSSLVFQVFNASASTSDTYLFREHTVKWIRFYTKSFLDKECSESREDPRRKHNRPRRTTSQDYTLRWNRWKSSVTAFQLRHHIIRTIRTLADYIFIMLRCSGVSSPVSEVVYIFLKNFIAGNGFPKSETRAARYLCCFEIYKFRAAKAFEVQRIDKKMTETSDGVGLYLKTFVI